MGKPRCFAKAAMLVVESGVHLIDELRERGRILAYALRATHLRAPRCGRQGAGKERIRYSIQHLGEPIPFDISAAAQHVAVWCQKRRGRPAAEAVTLADVGT